MAKPPIVPQHRNRQHLSTLVQTLARFWAASKPWGPLGTTQLVFSRFVVPTPHRHSGTQMSPTTRSTAPVSPNNLKRVTTEAASEIVASPAKKARRRVIDSDDIPASGSPSSKRIRKTIISEPEEVYIIPEVEKRETKFKGRLGNNLCASLGPFINSS